MSRIETISLVRTYVTFIVIVLVFSLTFFHFKNTSDTDQIIIPISDNTNNAPATIAPSTTLIESTTTTESPLTVIIPIQSPTQQPVPQNQNNEIDIIEEDIRTNIPNPCVSTISYTLGTFDTRFNISKNYFLQKIEESASLWNNAGNKNFFSYSPTKTPNGITINLIYDDRQARTDDTKLLTTEIENSQSVALALKKEYEAEKVDFDMQKEFYMQRVNAFNIRQKTYTDSVTSWNEKGGAPRQEYDTLMAEKDWLTKEAEYLMQEQVRLNSQLALINTKVAKYNELVSFSNERIALGNKFANKKFTEGKYNPNTGEVTIYQFSDDIKLSRVLTHELGHVLGIDHTKSKDSIMYAINNATSTSLNYEDIQEVQSLCQ